MDHCLSSYRLVGCSVRRPSVSPTRPLLSYWFVPPAIQCSSRKWPRFNQRTIPWQKPLQFCGLLTTFFEPNGLCPLLHHARFRSTAFALTEPVNYNQCTRQDCHKEHS